MSAARRFFTKISSFLLSSHFFRRHCPTTNASQSSVESVPRAIPCLDCSCLTALTWAFPRCQRIPSLLLFWLKRTRKVSFEQRRYSIRFLGTDCLDTDAHAFTAFLLSLSVFLSRRTHKFAYLCACSVRKKVNLLFIVRVEEKTKGLDNPSRPPCWRR